MVYRIHFTTEDLARTRVARAPSPLMELGASVRTLQSRDHPVLFGAWRRRVIHELRPSARMVLDLIPPRGWAPTFLTPGSVGDPEEILEQVCATPRSQVRKDLAHVAEWQPLPSWARRLVDDREAMRRLSEGLRHVHRVLLAPHWSRITAEAAADRAARARHILDGGVERLLVELNPRHIRWNPPVLELALLSGFDDDLHLGGRGLLLVPSAFGPDAPGIDIDAQPQPVLRYPVIAPSPTALRLFAPTAPPISSGTGSPLASLLGHTRAAVLQAVAEHPGCSTKELALHARVAPASASEHATVLRSAGLVRTLRHHNRALHVPTALGLSLLEGVGPFRPGTEADGTPDGSRG